MPIGYRVNFDVFTKLEHSVIGSGYQCKITRTEWKFSENFWADNFQILLNI